MDIQPVVLEGSHVRLEPLTMDHVAPLSQVAMDPAIWRWTHANVENVDDLTRYIRIALDERDQKKSSAYTSK